MNLFSLTRSRNLGCLLEILLPKQIESSAINLICTCYVALFFILFFKTQNTRLTSLPGSAVAIITVITNSIGNIIGGRRSENRDFWGTVCGQICFL
jgi:hypothetical protein